MIRRYLDEITTDNKRKVTDEKNTDITKEYGQHNDEPVMVDTIINSAVAEFQVVVLAAGKGSRMPELTVSKPKCLLPVGGKPMVWYPLNMIRQAGFSDVLMVVDEYQLSEIEATLDKSELEMKIEYFPISGNEDLGTADSLRLLNDKIKSDIIVVSCDLISNANLFDAIKLYRQHDASVCALLLQPQEYDRSLFVPGPKLKHKREPDIYGLDVQTNRISFLASASDFESEVPLATALLKKHREIVTYSNLLDSHIYILKKWVVKYLQQDQTISTIKGELLPYIIKRQLQKETRSTDAALPTKGNDILEFARQSKLSSKSMNNSSFIDHVGYLKPAYHGDSIRCYACIASNDIFGIRANTIRNYWLINKDIVVRWPELTGKAPFDRVDATADMKSNQVDDKCIIWGSAVLNPRTSFKSAIIGWSSEVKSFSRVFNSVVMNNVTIKEKVAIEGCIICDGAVIESGTQLKGCIVGSNHTVAENTECSNDVLTASERLLHL